jgi:hypothetical protein
MVGTDLPFSQRTPQMLMTIDNGRRISNTKYISFLPPSF